jgi:RNA polymerase sigma factor (sigma-70 family)
MSTLEQHAQAAADGNRESLEALVLAMQDDIYNLSMRMLGDPSDAQDATQEVLIKVITHVGSFRGESSFRTWVWRIATHHVLRMKRTPFEATMDFDLLEAMIDAGGSAVPVEAGEHEVQRLAEQVRLSCTQAMLIALDRLDRIVYILGDMFGLTSDQASQVLEIDPAAFRKRLERARKRLGEFMQRKCGLVDPVAACRCVRQIPVLMDRGLLDRKRLPLVDHTRRPATGPTLESAWGELSRLDAVARTMNDRPEYAVPGTVIDQLRELLNSGTFQLLQ